MLLCIFRDNLVPRLYHLNRGDNMEQSVHQACWQSPQVFDDSRMKTDHQRFQREATIGAERPSRGVDRQL